jgi:hypothetical protein
MRTTGADAETLTIQLLTFDCVAEVVVRDAPQWTVLGRGHQRNPDLGPLG